MELVVTCYGKEIDAIMNVSNNLAYMASISLCGDLNQCESFSYPTMDLAYTNQLPSKAVSALSYTHQQNEGNKYVEFHDSHQFNFHIDTGELHANENLGIWVLFKIFSPDGYATLDNLEVIEEGQTAGEALARVKHQGKNGSDK